MIKQKNRNKDPLRLFSLLLLASAIFLSGFLWGRDTSFNDFFTGSAQQPEKITADMKMFWNVWGLINENYKDVENVAEEDMVYGATRGLVNSLDDPYSQFLPPDVSKRFLENISGSFEGIGAEIGIKNDVLTIVAPLKGTPADKAGLQSGDKVIKINGTSTLNMSLDEAVSIIRGPKGSEVVLTILRGEDEQQADITIRRGTIKIPVINWELKDDGNIAYVEIYNFTENIGDEFGQIAQKILNSSAQKIVIDLRGNPGGYLNKAVDIAGWFLEDGDVVVMEDRGRGEKEEYKANGRGVFKDWPIVVLINEGSASASEIVAGALNDQLNATLVGKKSFGKGSVQEMIRLSKGASLKVTVADWITPSGLSINEAGLEPDVKVELTKDNLTNGEDPQLKKALDIIRSK